MRAQTRKAAVIRSGAIRRRTKSRQFRVTRKSARISREKFAGNYRCLSRDDNSNDQKRICDICLIRGCFERPFDPFEFAQGRLSLRMTVGSNRGRFCRSCPISLARWLCGLCRRLFLFDSRDVERGNCDATSIIEPDHDTRTSWIDSCMVRSWHPVLFSGTGNNRERLKRSHAQELSDIAYHCTRILSRVFAVCQQ